ncbi:hypothetical protein BH09SUM1_BH09SUM1_31730 [soil metagenome]
MSLHDAPAKNHELDDIPLREARDPAAYISSPSWMAVAVMELLREGLIVLRAHLEDQQEVQITWDHPWIELQFFADWEQHIRTRSAEGEVRPAPREGESFLGLKRRSSRQRYLQIFDALTVEPGRRKGGRSSGPFLAGRIEMSRDSIASQGPRSEHLAVVANILRDSLTFTNFLDEAYDVSIAAEFHPLMQEDEDRAYYPLVFGVVFHPQQGEENSLPTPASWSPEMRSDFWENLLRRLDINIMNLAERESNGALTPSPKPDKVVAPLRRVSVMSPVPIPRSLAKDAAGWALVRGLGRMFGGYRQIPDLDLQGRAATEEAESLFWKSLKQRMETHKIKYEQSREGSRTILTMKDITEREARHFWEGFAKSLNKGEKGPGLHISQAGFETANQYDKHHKKVATATRIVLWPEEALKASDDWPLPPVRFRNEGSPGYMDMLNKHGQRPFFADGWLWIPREGEREGFRIGGLSTLLFPEGRTAIERLKNKELEDYETRLNRIFQEPSLFQDEDERTIRELQSAIRRVKQWLKTLTTHDCMDLVLCIFEAFHRQRESWIAEELTLREGRRVRTTPWRVICLDPEELRSRLDPGRKLGQNWRNLLFEKLEALTTFERQTRTVVGRKVDVGDRFLMRVLDGYRGSDEQNLSESDPGMGLTRALRRANAFPIDAFFAVVSTDFMERLITWAVDENGVVRWGIDAAKAAERAALSTDPDAGKAARIIGQEVRQDARDRPYYEHSPRLLTFGNLQEWRLEWRIFAHLLLQETTPNFEPVRGERGAQKRRLKPNSLGGKHRLVQRGGDFYLSCNGNLGRGYRLKHWMNQAGFIKEPGSKEAAESFTFFVECLAVFQLSLGLRMELTPASGKPLFDDAAVKSLRAYRSHPYTAHPLNMKFYLPADLEKRLRDRLAEAGIDALDEGEAPPEIEGADARANNLITREQLRIARKKAGMTQADLGGRLAVSQQIVGYWEKGVKPIPMERQKELLEILQDNLEPNVIAGKG